MLHSLGCALPPADSEPGVSTLVPLLPPADTDAHETVDESELRVGVGGASHFELGVVLSLLHALVPASAARAGSLASEDAGLKPEGSPDGGAAEAAATAHAPAVRPFPLPVGRSSQCVRPWHTACVVRRALLRGALGEGLGGSVWSGGPGEERCG